MAFYDRAGWMRTIEEVEETPEDVCQKALTTIFGYAPTPEDAINAIYALGLEESWFKRMKNR